jgi:pimeloyl-ACP methyl ester carboxylesterase
MELSNPNNPRTGSVASKDGTKIGYRQVGSGPGVILVHGAMQTSRSFTKLANALAAEFSVYVPDRRGRGLSGPFGENYAMEREVEDLGALIGATGAQNVFGLSSGALIALQGAYSLTSIRKVALYEPPLGVAGVASPTAWVERYERELARGDLAAAMVAAIKGTGDRSLFTALPRFIMVPLMRRAIHASASETDARNASLEVLIPTVHFDARLAEQMADTIERFRTVPTEMLLIGGNRSIGYLRAALDALEGVLPRVSRVELAGVGHLAADDTGAPERVANELRRFF